MSEKDQDLKQNGQVDEPVLDFEQAKDMTVGQAVRKSEELKAGVTDDDSILDRYIKQHRQDIEAEKFDATAKGDTLSTEVKAVEEEPVAPTSEEDPSSEPLVDTEELDAQTQEAVDALGIHRHDSLEATGGEADGLVFDVADPLEVPLAQSAETEAEAIVESGAEAVENVQEESVKVADYSPESAPFNHLEDEGSSSSKRGRIFLWSALAIVLGAAAVGGTLLLTRNQQNSTDTATSSSSSSASSTTSSSSTSQADQQALEEFNTRFATFFTDQQQTKLKNSEFGKLSELQTILDKMDQNSDAYKTAKAKFDQLNSAIQATQKLNQQFSGDLIVDGNLNTTVQVKSGADLSVTHSGLAGVDSLLDSAAAFGRSQETVNQTPAASAPVVQGNGGASATPTPAADTASNSANPAPASNATVNSSDWASLPFTYTGYGLRLPNGVTLQRQLSRVPYNRDILADRDNSAWGFADGVLDRILTTSRQRGYIQGDNYILERVNIINGNAYYNLFKPDGTYLFSINARTGYFVGNGRGYADALDY